MAAAAEAAGRPLGDAERQLISRLRDNWFETAADLAAMSREDVTALKVPRRVWTYVVEVLKEGEDEQADGEGPGLAAVAAATAAEASEAAAARGAAAGEDCKALTDGRAENRSPVGSRGQPEERPVPSVTGSPSTSSSDEVQGTDSSGEAGSAGFELEGGAAAGADGELHPDIMQRRAPLRRRLFPKGHIKVSQRVQLPPYGITESELTPALREELEALRTFSCTRFFGQRVEPIGAATFKVDMQYLRMMLGWLHRRRGVPLAELSLRCLLPSSEEQGVAVVFDFVEFLVQERGVNARTQFNTLSTCVHVVRFLYHSESKPDPANPRDAPYSDLPVMKALKNLVAKAHKASKKAPLVSDERLKWLEWSEFLALIRGLREECAGLTASGAPRSRKEVALCLQRYLVFAILSCIPDRQRTIRELQVGRTLFKEDGRWVIRHSPSDYKTGKLYGKRPPLVIAPFVYPELEAFINVFRAELAPSHDMLFSRASGLPMTDNSLYDMFVHTAQRRTGKPTNPHLIRDMVVTHLRTQGTSEGEMEALAIYMGHSITMQRDTYDRRTRDQKVTPAVALMERMSTGTM